MTAIRGAAAAVTGAASGIGRALALELAARGCDLALADRDEAGLQAVAAEIAKAHQHAKSHAAPRRCRRAASRSQAFAQAAIAAHPGAQHRHQQCRRRADGPVRRDRPGADGLADEHQFLGRGARHPRLPAASCAASARPTSSTSPASSASSRRRARPPMPRRNSRCAAFRKACGTSCRWRTARSGCRWCIPAASPPTSRATPAPAPASPTTRAARSRSSVSTRWRRTTPKAAALRIINGIEKNQPRILIGNDARFMDLLQRFRPATYWTVLARRIEKMAKRGK